MTPIIETEKLEVGYDANSVVSGINISALRGQVICLLGPNGAGKSTVLRTLAGLLAPVNGTIKLDGEVLSKKKKTQIAKKISVVLTEQIAPSMLTVYGIVSMGRTPYSDFLGRLSTKDQTIITQALQTVGAEDIKDRFFSALSDGEKQKVMIARALVQEPELIILDEPTSHLDIKYKIEVIKILQNLANEKSITCILSLHDIDLALKGCQTVLMVENGKIVAQGMPEEVVKHGMIQKLYDLNGAEYHEMMGSVELKGKETNEIFITGGGASGTQLYRVLSRMGFGITTGVIHENDFDFQIAKTICYKVVSEKAFECISQGSKKSAICLMKEAKCIVDSGFPVGRGNIVNMEMLKEMLHQGKNIYTVRPKKECEYYFGDESNQLIFIDSITQIVKEIKEVCC